MTAEAPASVTDWGGLYRANAEAVTALAADLTEDQLATTVPGSPAWTVRDVLAHLAGGPADAVSGRMDGAPGPEWTARHVAERAGMPVSALVEEIGSHVEEVADSTVDSPRPAIVWDLAVHHADLHEALGLGQMPEELWMPVLRTAGPMVLDALPVEVRTGDTVFGQGEESVEVAPYELFRALFSRRSRAQMAAWGSPGLDDAQLEGLCIFGARDDDQPVPER